MGCVVKCGWLHLLLHDEFYTVHLLWCFLLTKVTLTWMAFTGVPPIVQWISWGILEDGFWHLSTDWAVALCNYLEDIVLLFPWSSLPRGRTVTTIVHANPYQTSSNQQLTLNKYVLFFSTQSSAVTWMSFEDCYYVFLLHL